jgi:hypothetical protein
MFAEEDPFWFVSTELLTRMFHSEINVVTQLLANHSDFRKLLDAPEAEVPERTACFALLAHRKLLEMIDEKFVARYESTSLDDVESNTLKLTYDLVSADAPAWALEMHQVVERLPVHIYTSLPEPLRMGGINRDNVEQMQAVKSAKKTLSNVEQIRALTERVLDQQLNRLKRRWSAAIPISQQEPVTKAKALQGTEGLVSRNNLSRYSQYMDKLTEKQHLAFRLKFEFELRLTDIASRMGIDRKTADEHIKAAVKKVEQARSNEKRKGRRAKNAPEF